MRFILLLSLCCLCSNQAIPSAKAETSCESEIWSTLKDSVVQIYALNTKLSYEQYSELTKQIYDYCTRASILSQHRVSGGAETIDVELYQSLGNFLKNHLSNIVKAASNLGEVELLSFHAKNWKDYQISSSTINKLFTYLNRHFVKRERDGGNKDVYRVYDMTIFTWREHLFKEFNERLTSVILVLIERERNGEIINSYLISRAIASYIELGIDKDAPNAGVTNLSVYRSNFEKIFINETERYYTAERDEFVQQNSFTEYMKRCERRISEEKTRIQAYLHGTTLSTLLKSCDRILITNFLPTFHTEFQNYLDANEFDALGRLYFLTRR